MALGILILVSGVLIALYPPLLSLIVALLLIFAGVTITLMSYRYKKMSKRSEDPFFDFFMKL
ncbi:MAG: hypothetical protein PHH49_01060 [Candidatus Omnitrophica bacterium]|nr:hypothetical protein [Candidatus Omnitrophota bacterium]MDD5487542.1 hypothetical protein [Candidatus Omnitrophota bacterium]